MNSVSEIRHHIRAVEDTEKITRAMYLISSAKMRRASKMLAQDVIYSDLLRQNLEFVLSHIRQEGYPLFDGGRSGKCAHLVIAGDKGLCGNYNVQILRHARASLTGETLVYPIGHVALEMLKNQYACDDAFVHVIHDPDISHARAIAAHLWEKYLAQEISRVFVTYTFSRKRGVIEPVTQQLLPLAVQAQQEPRAKEPGFLLLPDEKTLLDTVGGHFLVGQLYTALVQAFFCEHYARMNAMDTAKNNAEEMLARLRLEMNHARQAQITGEITEIVAGQFGGEE